MNSIGISFGQTASHSPILVQLPNSSRLAVATIFSTRVARSGCPCGRVPRWVTLAAVNSEADAFGQAATQAPQPIHAAASMDISAPGFGTRIAFPSGAQPVGAET